MIRVSAVRNGAAALAAVLFGVLLIGVMPSQIASLSGAGTPTLQYRAGSGAPVSSESAPVKALTDEKNPSPDAGTKTDTLNDTVSVGSLGVESKFTVTTPEEPDALTSVLSDAGYYGMLAASLLVALAAYLLARLRAS